MKHYNDIETVSDLKNQIDLYHGEIGCNGKSTGSHSYPSTLSFYNRTTEKWMRLAEIDIDRHGGCNCWVGLEFEFEEMEE
jgi:hypothetical protein